MAEERYCPSCGEDVETIVMVREGDEEVACANCGFVFKNSVTPLKTLRAVLVAEDSPALLRKASETIEAREVAKTVVSCRNGEEFLETAVSRMRAGLPISMVILDINMPILNGVNAAIALRAVERGMGSREKIPVLFFTANRCDDTMKKVLKFCAPAHYINKGAGSGPDEFARRLHEVISGFLQSGAKK